MLILRPIIIDKDNIVIGGNQRYEALVAMGYNNIPDEWVKRADKLTEEERKRFIILDNLPFGEFDYEKLANTWNEKELRLWGMDLPYFEDVGALDDDNFGS